MPDPKLRESLLELCKSFAIQAVSSPDLDPQDVPDEADIEAEAAWHCNFILRVLPISAAKGVLSQAEPDNSANRAVVTEMAAEASSLDKTTSAFTTFALSKVGEAGYQSGWPLSALRIAIEIGITDAKRLHAEWNKEPRSMQELLSEVKDVLLEIRPKKAISIWVSGEVSENSAQTDFDYKTASGKQEWLNPDMDLSSKAAQAFIELRQRVVKDEARTISKIRIEVGVTGDITLETE